MTLSDAAIAIVALATIINTIHLFTLSRRLRKIDIYVNHLEQLVNEQASILRQRGNR